MACVFGWCNAVMFQCPGEAMKVECEAIVGYYILVGYKRLY
jgi:hypothetical protein